MAAADDDRFDEEYHAWLQENRVTVDGSGRIIEPALGTPRDDYTYVECSRCGQKIARSFPDGISLVGNATQEGLFFRPDEPPSGEIEAWCPGCRRWGWLDVARVRRLTGYGRRDIKVRLRWFGQAVT